MTLGRALTIMPRRAMSSQVSKSGGPEVSASITGNTSVNHNEEGVGFKADKNTRDTFFNPLLTPPPRSPRSPEDFSNPSRLGHWKPIGFDFYDPVKDKFRFHEMMFGFFTCGILTFWLYSYAPDYKHREWARREAFLRTTKREALGIPLIDPNVVDPDRIVLPTEEELADFDLEITQ